jgi:serine/threonine protein kinase
VACKYVNIEEWERETTFGNRLKGVKHVQTISDAFRLTSEEVGVIVTEYIDAPHHFKPQNITQIKIYLKGLAEALFELHSRGIVHGDIKISNALFHRERGTILGDFGCAFQLAEGQDAYNAQGWGTITTKAPEVGLSEGRPDEIWWFKSEGSVHGDNCGRHSDMWSLGVVAFQLLFPQSVYNFEDAVKISDLMAICDNWAALQKKIDSVDWMEFVGLGWERFTREEPESYDFVRRLLQFFPEKRMTAAL